MIVPNKFFSYNETILKKSLYIMMESHRKKIGIKDLYKEKRKCFIGIDEYLLTLDLLYILGEIEIDFNTEVINYVK
jgi:hypothetical protein